MSTSIQSHQTSNRHSIMSHYAELNLGLKLYRDEEVSHVNMNDTSQMWNILVFNSSLVSADRGLMKSGIYITPSVCPSVYFNIGEGFSGYLLSVPLSSWKLFDIYDLDNYFMSGHSIPYVELDPLNLRSIGLMMDILEDAIEAEDSHFKIMEELYLCRALLTTINRFYYQQGVTVQPVPGTCNLLVDRFQRLVDANCLKERKLEFYAKELNISVKYLSSLVSRVTGKKANKWISECVIDQMKKLLATTAKPILEISEYTGFATSSDFCRFFKAHTGATPLQYRKSTMRFGYSGSEKSNSLV